MLIIDSPSTNAYFNIASEEYLLGRFPKEDIFLLYVNAPSIIVGKFQNTLAEINLDYVQEKEIKVVRRMSGGCCRTSSRTTPSPSNRAADGCRANG